MGSLKDSRMLKKLGKYEIKEILGRGSMGVVYKGLDPELGKLVAIKTMNQKILQQDDLKERFFREGKILGQLNHQNIISVYNTGKDGDIYYIAMEFLGGGNLETLLKEQKQLSLERALKIIQQVCEGVHAAHQLSIIHRDLKPANVHLLDDDHVKVLDFGVAYFQNSQLTNSGVLLGTINYIAPEQITGVKVDYRADIFSVGVMLYELLTGANPFLGKNLSQTMVRIVNDNPKPLPDAPPQLQRVIEKALHKDRNRRYISAKLMASDIERVLRGDDRRATPRIDDQPKPQRSSQQSILQKMVQERIDDVLGHLQRDELTQASDKLDQLRRLSPNHERIHDLSMQLEKSRRRDEEKRYFVEQLAQDTLRRANEYLRQRHFVLAVELCDKVLQVDPEQQDAKVIRAAALRKLEQFLNQAK